MGIKVVMSSKAVEGLKAVECGKCKKPFKKNKDGKFVASCNCHETDLSVRIN